MVFLGSPELPGDSESDNFCSPVANLAAFQQNNSDDSENESIDVYEGYQPLPMTATGFNENNDDIDEENDDYDLLQYPAISVEQPGIPQNNISSDTELICEVWSAPRPQELNIELDQSRTDEILNAMASITLPSSAIPDWAHGVPEDKWKEDLLLRIRQRGSASILLSEGITESSPQ